MYERLFQWLKLHFPSEEKGWMQCCVCPNLPGFSLALWSEFLKDSEIIVGFFWFFFKVYAFFFFFLICTFLPTLGNPKCSNYCQHPNTALSNFFIAKKTMEVHGLQLNFFVCCFLRRKTVPANLGHLFQSHFPQVKCLSLETSQHLSP